MAVFILSQLLLNISMATAINANISTKRQHLNRLWQMLAGIGRQGQPIKLLDSQHGPGLDSSANMLQLMGTVLHGRWRNNHAYFAGGQIGYYQLGNIGQLHQNRLATLNTSLQQLRSEIITGIVEF